MCYINSFDSIAASRTSLLVLRHILEWMMIPNIYVYLRNFPGGLYDTPRVARITIGTQQTRCMLEEKGTEAEIGERA